MHSSAINDLFVRIRFCFPCRLPDRVFLSVRITTTRDRLKNTSNLFMCNNVLQMKSDYPDATDQLFGSIIIGFSFWKKCLLCYRTMLKKQNKLNNLNEWFLNLLKSFKLKRKQNLSLKWKWLQSTNHPVHMCTFCTLFTVKKGVVFHLLAKERMLIYSFVPCATVAMPFADMGKKPFLPYFEYIFGIFHNNILRIFVRNTIF